MSPIFVRPVREQLEHDRLVRHLQAKYKRKFEVAVNMGEEQIAPVKIGALTLFPDLVLTEKKKMAGIVEVESGESVNNLEAMAQWVHFSRSRVPFHLYVPVATFETARRLCEAHQARVSEIWTYRPAIDGFDLVRMSVDAGAVRASAPFRSAAAKAAAAAKPPAKPKPAPAPPAKPQKAAAKGVRKAPAGKKVAPKSRPKGAPKRKR